jgi:hypothetical protein
MLLDLTHMPSVVNSLLFRGVPVIYSIVVLRINYVLPFPFTEGQSDED